MTTPNNDWVPASVKSGFSEALAALAFLSSLLTSYFGQDWGISKNAQAIAGLGVIIIPALTGLIRAIKHRSAQQANAAVAAAKIQATAITDAAYLAKVGSPPAVPEPEAPVAPAASRAARVARAKSR